MQANNCENRQKYVEADAHVALQVLQRSDRPDKDQWQVRACAACGLWHLEIKQLLASAAATQTR